VQTTRGSFPSALPELISNAIAMGAHGRRLSRIANAIYDFGEICISDPSVALREWRQIARGALPEFRRTCGRAAIEGSYGAGVNW